MPTRRRGQGDGSLKPSIVHFLATGETAMAERDISVWVKVTLMDEAAFEARRLWAIGDAAGAVAALRKTSASHNLFVQPAGILP